MVVKFIFILITLTTRRNISKRKTQIEETWEETKNIILETSKVILPKKYNV